MRHDMQLTEDGWAQLIGLWVMLLGGCAGAWALWPAHPFWAAAAAGIAIFAGAELALGLGHAVMIWVVMFALMSFPMFLVMGLQGLGVAAVMALMFVAIV